jgi:hypothetical protein
MVLIAPAQFASNALLLVEAVNFAIVPAQPDELMQNVVKAEDGENRRREDYDQRQEMNVMVAHGIHSNGNAPNGHHMGRGFLVH